MPLEQVFASDRLLYVKVDEGLIPDYLAMINDEEHVRRFIGRMKAVTHESEVKWVRRKLAEQARVYSMIEKQSGRFVGNVELMDVDESTAELGIAITAQMQNKGYGKEAVRAVTAYGLEQLGLQRILLKVFPANARAIHVYLSCGFCEYDRTLDDVFMHICRAGN